MHKSMQVVRIFEDVDGSWQEQFILEQRSLAVKHNASDRK